MNEELKVIISAEIGKLKKAIGQAKSEIGGLDDKAKETAKKMEASFKNAGDAIGKGLKTAGTAIAAIGTAMVGSAAATEEYRANQAKLNAAFETAGASADVAKGVYNDLYRVLGESDTSVEAANHLAQLTANEKDLSEWTNICQGVYATFGASLPIESLTESANETAKVGTVTGSLADALNWAGISEEQFNEKLAACNDEAEREQLIRETLNGTYNEAAAAYEEQAGSIMAQRDAQAKLAEVLAQLGEAMAPVLTAFMTFATEALQPVIEKIAPLAEQYAPQLQEAMSAAGEAVGKAFGFFVDNWEIFAAIGGVIAGIAAAIGIYNVVAAIKATMDALQVTTLGGLIAALWAQVAAQMAALAPYLLIVAAIAAVIAIIVLCVKHWDTIKAKVVEVTKAIWGKVKEMADKVAQFFTEIRDKAAAKVDELKSAMSQKWESVKTAVSEKASAIKEAAVSKFSEIKDGISEKVESAKSKVSETFSSIKSNMTDKVNGAKTAVLNVFSNIKSGIQEKIQAARDAVKTAIDKIKGFMNFKWSLPKLKMPSIKITGKFSLNPPSVPKFSINWNAMGGIFDKPTLFSYGGSLQGIGERGAEAVVPLENNLGWLSKLAKMLNEEMGGGRNYVMEVDGKTFAQVAIDTINQNTRQTGRLNLNLA